MLGKKLQVELLHVDTFDVGPVSPSAYLLAASDPVSDPSTYEDTCILMCPTDDTCTRLGCKTQLA